MTPYLILLLISTFTLGLATYFFNFSHALKKRFFRQKIDYLQFYILFIASPILLLTFFLLYYSVIARPAAHVLPLPDIIITLTAFLVACTAAMGIGAHTASKSVSLHLNQKDNPKAYEVNHFFHGSLSHYMAYHAGIILVLLLAMAEINHPEPTIIPIFTRNLLFFLGAMVGFSSSLGILNLTFWKDNTWKTNFFVLFGASSILGLIFIGYRPAFAYLPITIFCSTAIFSTFAVVAFFYRLSRKEQSRIIKFLKTKLENIYPSLISYLPQKGK